jgi:hypothetical protein
VSNLASAFLSWSECYALRIVYTTLFGTNKKRARKFTKEEIGKQKELREHLPALLMQGRE